MTDAANYLNSGLLGEIAGTNFAPPAALWVQLFAGPPGPAGDQNPAFTVARRQFAFTAPAGTPPFVITNSALIEWLTWSTLNPNTPDHVRYWAAFDAATAGHCLARAPLGGFYSKAASALASSDVFTVLGTGFVLGDIVDVYHEEGGAPLTTGVHGIAEDTNYYVIAPNPPQFQLSATPGGSALDVKIDTLLRVRQILDYSINPNMPVRIPANGLSMRFE